MVNPFNFSDFLDFSGQRILTHTPKRAAASRKCSEFSESTTRKRLPSGSVECIWPFFLIFVVCSGPRPEAQPDRAQIFFRWDLGKRREKHRSRGEFD